MEELQADKPVGAAFKELQLGNYTKCFTDEGAVVISDLRALSEEDLSELIDAAGMKKMEASRLRKSLYPDSVGVSGAHGSGGPTTPQETQPQPQTQKKAQGSHGAKLLADRSLASAGTTRSADEQRPVERAPDKEKAAKSIAELATAIGTLSHRYSPV